MKKRNKNGRKITCQHEKIKKNIYNLQDFLSAAEEVPQQPQVANEDEICQRKSQSLKKIKKIFF